MFIEMNKETMAWPIALTLIGMTMDREVTMALRKMMVFWTRRRRRATSQMMERIWMITWTSK